MTGAPPSLRSHRISALACLAFLCALVAWPVAAAPPAGNGPPAHAGNGPPAHAGKGPPAHAGKGKQRARQARAHARERAKGQASHARERARQQASQAREQARKVRDQAREQASRARDQAREQASMVREQGRAAREQRRGAPGNETLSIARASASGRAHGGRVRAAAARRRTVAARAARAAASERRARDARRSALAEPAASTGAAAGAFTTSRPSRAGRDPAPEGEDSGRPSFVPITPQEVPQQAIRVVPDIVEVVPTPVRLLLAALLALSLLLGIAYVLTMLRARRLAQQRRELLGDVGLLQAALLPELPKGLAYCRASVAYRPADGPGAGGDFYDVLALAGGRTAVIIGDVSGHGRAALARTALSRYTLRAYVEAGLEPRETLQIAGSVLAGKLQGDFVTALVAVHDPAAGTLTYATAGHPPPIVFTPGGFDPVIVGTAPPLGAGASTGQRQTTVAFPRGAIACFYTDGLAEARTGNNGRLGSDRLEQLVRELGPDVTAKQVIDCVAGPAGTITDDAAVCVLAAEAGTGIVRGRVERLEISRAELRGPLLPGFLDACGVSPYAVRATQRDAREVAQRAGGALIEVTMGERAEVDVRPPEIPLGEELALSDRTRF